jgi:class 3 adenylate cyclase/tetratricopeptide (TPR) repeat protein
VADRHPGDCLEKSAVGVSPEERERLEKAIAALESQRGVLGGTVVDSAVGPLRKRLQEGSAAASGAARLEGERKLVTVMFADLSGFTALSEALDPEQVRGIVNRCFNALVPIVERYGGTVDKFIGDEIMALFGAPSAHENDAERALRAALDMREALAGLNATDGTSLGMHIGVNSGTVVTGGLGSDGREQYSVIGDTVNLAARLAAAAPGGEILVGPTTRRLTSLLFDFTVLPPMAVKGKTEPVAVARLEDARPDAGRVHGVAGLVSPLVGRDRELDLLIGEVHHLQSGSGGIVAITGDPGLGKSRLVAETRQHTEIEARWIEGRAQSYTESMNFSMARSLLSAFLGLRPDAAPADVEQALQALLRALFGADELEDIHPYLARLCDLATGTESRLAGLSPEALRVGMRRAFARLVSALCAERPLVLVWEDLHWADPSSLDLLATLVPLVGEQPLLLVLAFRPQEGEALEWYGRTLGDATAGSAELRTCAIELAPLTEVDSRRLVENLLRVENLPAVARRMILKKAEGNPFFLEELLRSLVDSGLLLVDGDRVVATRPIEDVDVPDTVQGVIAARIDRLPADDKRTLQTAAVIGRVFQEVVLAWLVERQGVCEDLSPHLAELERHELVRRRSDLELIFKHAITQDVTYHSLLVSRREQLHRVTAEAIEALFPDRLQELSGTLAHHYGLAASPTKALHYLTIAAGRAASTYSNDEAIAYYRSALDAARDAGVQDAAALHEDLGDLLATSGEHAPARAEFLAALDATSQTAVVARARLHRRMAKAWVAERRFGEAVEEFAVADQTLGERPEETDLDWWREWVQIQSDLAWLHYWDNRVDQMVLLVADVRPVVERVGTPRQRGAFFNALLLMELRRRRYVVSGEMLGYGRAYVAAQREVGDPGESGLAHFMNGFAHLWYGDLDTAETELESSLALAIRTGDVTTQARCLTYLTVGARKRGLVERVRHLAAQSLAAAAAAHMPEYTATAHANLAWADWRDARWAECEAKARTALGEWRDLPTGHASAAFQWTALWPLIGVCLAEGRTGEALDHSGELLAPELMRLPAEIETVIDGALESWGRGETHTTTELLGEAVVQAQQTGWL